MTNARRFTASDLHDGVHVVLANVLRMPLAEGTLELCGDRIFLHTLMGYTEELPADLNAIAARVVEIVVAA